MPPAKCCFYHHQMHSAYNEPFLSVDLKQKRSQQKKKSSNSQVIIFNNITLQKISFKSTYKLKQKLIFLYSFQQNLCQIDFTNDEKPV